MNTLSVGHHVSRHEAPESWMKPSHARSVIKLVIYAGSLVALVWTLLIAENELIILGLQLSLGVVFAHGLELQHECLHHNMFRSPSLNRLCGAMLGVPMLVSYTHYKIQHLHHHKFVGTPEDAEIFDYRASQFTSLPGLISRVWNLARIPMFLLTFIGILQGRMPSAFEQEGRKRRHLRLEYWLIATLFVTALIVTACANVHVFIRVWFIPWLLFAEVTHVLIELPEHIGCDRNVADPRWNTRSYATNCVWQYIANWNNYHVEHHCWPNLSTGHLREASEILRATERHCARSYWAAASAVIKSIRDSSRSEARALLEP